MSEQSGHTTEKDARSEHQFLPVAGHPDDDECTHRSDGTDASYCGRTRAWHDHHPSCYQNTGTPDDLPDDLCDCRILRMIDAHEPRVIPPGSPTHESAESGEGCLHDWTLRPESDTWVCELCGAER